MRKFKTSYLVIILSFAGTLLLLFGSFNSYQYFGFKKPLTEAIIDDLNINEHNIIIDKKQKTIDIAYKTDNLMDDFQKIQTIIDQYDQADSYSIHFIDQPDEQINQTYKELSFSLYEILETKRYREFDNLQSNIEKPQSLYIEMDDNFIYLNLKNGEHYLYEIIPRNQMMGW